MKWFFDIAVIFAAVGGFFFVMAAGEWCVNAVYRFSPAFRRWYDDFYDRLPMSNEEEYDGIHW